MFAGGWTLEAAEQVAGDVLDALEALVDRSLVVRAGERFQMLDTIREFARERLDDAVRDRHAAWALELAEAAEAGLEGAEQTGWMRRLDAERENLVAAAEWGDAESRQRIAGALWRYWLARGAVAEGRRLVEGALAAGAASATAAARAHNAAGILAGAAGDHEAARAAFGAALEHVDDRRREARVITNLGVLDVFASDYDAAQARYEAAAEIYREVGDVRGQSIVTQNLAIAHELSGDVDGAVPLLEESVELARAAGDPAHVASTLHVLGSLLARRGDLDRAVPLVLESLELGRGENALTVECLETLASVVDPVTGATLLGAAEAQREATGAVRQPDEQPAVDDLVAALQAALKPDALEVALERGRRTELAAAVELAMAAARSRSG